MKSKAWLKESSFAYVAVKKIVLDKRLLNDLKYLIDFNHTGALEVYHSLYNKCSSKRLHFSYPVMTARAQLAVPDFNFRVGLAHRKNKQGDLQYKHQFSKMTQSWVVKKYTKGKKRTGKSICKWHPLITKFQSQLMFQSILEVWRNQKKLKPFQT